MASVFDGDLLGENLYLLLGWAAATLSVKASEFNEYTHYYLPYH